jgi:DNA-binding GntR family transcriptional regulator
VREALRQLLERGLVVKDYRRGYRVIEVTAKQVEDMFATRLVLDNLAIQQLIGRSDLDSVVDELEERLRALDAATTGSDVNGVIDADLSFHQTIASASTNEILAAIHARVVDPLRPVLALMAPDEMPAALVVEHRRIVRAIKARQLAGAERALFLHNSQALALIRRLMKAEPHEPSETNLTSASA